MASSKIIRIGMTPVTLIIVHYALLIYKGWLTTGLPLVSPVIKCKSFSVVVSLTIFVSHSSLQLQIMLIQTAMFVWFRNKWQLSGMYKSETIIKLTILQILHGLTTFQYATSSELTRKLPFWNLRKIFLKEQVWLSCMFT